MVTQHELKPLPYAYDALEPFFDEATMRLHHGKHHQTYVDKLNAALEKHPELFEKKLDDLLKDLNAVPEDIRAAVRNHAGGHSNHQFFWNSLKKDTKLDNGLLLSSISKDFASFDDFKKQFANSAAALFGSGWTWLVKDKSGKLLILNLPNQDSPFSQDLIPVLGLDVWEHAYYLKYQNRRAEFIEAFFNVINWPVVEKNFGKK